jgi:aminoglycoside phosphotransferase (APT) family kinase protein
VSFELYKGGYHAGQADLEQRLSALLEPAELDAIAGRRRALDGALPPPVLLHADIKPEHLLHDPATGALTGLLDWGDASLGQSEFDLAIVRMFCGPRTLEGLLDRLDPAAAECARAWIPFLLMLREVQDAVYDIELGDEPSLAGLRDALSR